MGAWSYFIYTGSISTIWPMFGISNQLLASVALCVATAWFLNTGRAKYVWVTLLPLSFVGVTTLTAGWMSITDNFYPLTQSGDPAKIHQGWVNISLTATIMILAVLIYLDTLRKGWKALSSKHRLATETL